MNSNNIKNTKNLQNHNPTHTFEDIIPLHNHNLKSNKNYDNIKFSKIIEDIALNKQNESLLDKYKEILLQNVSYKSQKIWQIIFELHAEELFLMSILILFSIGIFFTLMWKYDIKVYVFFSTIAMIVYNWIYFNDFMNFSSENIAHYEIFLKISCVLWFLFVIILHMRWHTKNNGVEIILFKSLILFLGSLILRFYNIISFLIILEIISLLSFIIVGFENRNKHSILASARYLLLSFLPTIFLILWVLIIYKNTSVLHFTFLFSDLAGAKHVNIAHNDYSVLPKNWIYMSELTKLAYLTNNKDNSIYNISFVDIFNENDGRRDTLGKLNEVMDRFQYAFYRYVFVSVIELYKESSSFYTYEEKKNILITQTIPFIVEYDTSGLYVDKEEIISLFYQSLTEEFQNVETLDKIVKICQEGDKKGIK